MVVHMCLQLNVHLIQSLLIKSDNCIDESNEEDLSILVRVISQRCQDYYFETPCDFDQKTNNSNIAVSFK